MPSIEMHGWPVVQVEFAKPASDQEAQQWLDGVDKLLARQQPFVMLVHARPNSHFSADARKSLGLWFKERRQLLGEYCVGVARLVDSEEQGARVVSEKMKQAMPFPMTATTCAETAQNWLDQQLLSH